MKLLRYGPAGQEKPGLLDRDGKIRDLSGTVRDIDGESLAPAALDRLRRLDPASLPLVPGNPRLGPCVGHVPKLVAIGLNYRDHAAETGAAIPKEPIIFMKATSCISGPNDDVMIPRGSEKTDWEVELGIVIGSIARSVALPDARRHVAGYCVVNDVSEREFQIERGGQWTKGKSADTFGPIGPFVVTTDELADPEKLALFTEVNSRRMQNGTTANLIFGVDHLVSYVSHFMTLM
ncbi:MAG: fumarylacetoacetate hydrolase family protein, partial [Stellaceae bacterium]